MSKKTDGVMRDIYGPHRTGGKFYNNPTTTEVTAIEMIFTRKFREMCINRFKWEGLPDEIDPRFVETILFEQALIVYCEPEQYNPTYPNGERILKDGQAMMLRATPTGYLDYQDNPLAYNVFANQMFSALIDADDCVPVWANTARIPDIDIVMWYARRLAEAERTIDINLKNARHTRLITAPEEQRLTVVNALRLIDQGEPAVFGTDMMNRDAFQALDMGMDKDILQAVAVAKNQITNDCMTMLGLNNANQDKKERLIAGEVDARSEQVGINRAIALNERQAGAQRINKMFGTDIKVSWNDEILATDEDKEGGDNGNIHDGTTNNDEIDR